MYEKTEICEEKNKITQGIQKSEVNTTNNRKFSYLPVKISNTFNAGKDYEQKRLREKFKDNDIIVEKNCASYVKGRLQPTKSLGDFYLKFKEFNNPPFNMEERYSRRTIHDFNGPYIDHIPDIKIFELTADDEFVVLGTDGLWDWVTPQEVAEIINSYREDKEMIVLSLWKLALIKAGEKVNLKLEEVKSLPHSIRRSIHDDITILIVDLKNQVL
jgi:pyruvate dehydrogenase phosphatase